jgi:hypothetical protein
MMKQTYLLLAIFIAFAVAEPSQRPVRTRFNANLMKKIIHKNDHSLLALMGNMEIPTSVLLSDDFRIQNMVVSVSLPENVKPEDFDI